MSDEKTPQSGNSAEWYDPIEKRPPEGVEVLIAYDDDTEGVGTWTGNQYGWKDCKPDKFHIVAWAPKPEAQQPDNRACTCHPDDNPPTSCPRKFALSECRASVHQTRNETMDFDKHSDQPLTDGQRSILDKMAPARETRVTACGLRWDKRCDDPACHPRCKKSEMPQAPTQAESIAEQREVLESRSVLQVSVEGPARWRHVKRGTVYESVGAARAQAADPIHDGDKVLVYRSEDDGSLWCRPEHEFLDGRFEAVERKLLNVGVEQQAVAVLRELVRLKDMKDRIDQLPRGTFTAEVVEYRKAKPLAWEAARKFLSQGTER